MGGAAQLPSRLAGRFFSEPASTDGSDQPFRVSHLRLLRMRPRSPLKREGLPRPGGRKNAAHGVCETIRIDASGSTFASSHGEMDSVHSPLDVSLRYQSRKKGIHGVPAKHSGVPVAVEWQMPAEMASALRRGVETNERKISARLLCSTGSRYHSRPGRVGRVRQARLQEFRQLLPNNLARAASSSVDCQFSLFPRQLAMAKARRCVRVAFSDLQACRHARWEMRMRQQNLRTSGSSLDFLGDVLRTFSHFLQRYTSNIRLLFVFRHGSMALDSLRAQGRATLGAPAEDAFGRGYLAPGSIPVTIGGCW